MTKQVLKTVLAGILAGIAVFMMPFVIIKVLLFFVLIRAIFRLMGGGRRHHWRYAYAQKYNNMSAEERQAFMHKYGHRCGWQAHCGPAEPEHKEKDDKTSAD